MRRILRWVVLLPIAVIAGWLAYFVGGFINRLGFISFYGQPPTGWHEVILDFMGHMYMGAAATYAAAYLAPDHNKYVALSMAGLCLLLAGGAIFAAFLASDYKALLASLGFAFGSIAVAVDALRGKSVQQ